MSKLQGIVKTILNNSVVNGTVKGFKDGVYTIKVAGSIKPLKRHKEAVWR